MDQQLWDTLVEHGYHPLAHSGDDEPDGYRGLYESEGWYRGCGILVPEGEYSETLTDQWFE